MNILYLLPDGPDALRDRIIGVHSKEHEVTVIDLSKRDLSYEKVVDEIFAHDKVISW